MNYNVSVIGSLDILYSGNFKECEEAIRLSSPTIKIERQKPLPEGNGYIIWEDGDPERKFTYPADWIPKMNWAAAVMNS